VKPLKPEYAADESEDEKGRASAFKSKRSKMKPHKPPTLPVNTTNKSQNEVEAIEPRDSEVKPLNSLHDESRRVKQKEHSADEAKRSEVRSGSSKRAASFLDEILGERKKKKKRAKE
jgi:hypothetical protein